MTAIKWLWIKGNAVLAGYSTTHFKIAADHPSNWKWRCRGEAAANVRAFSDWMGDDVRPMAIRNGTFVETRRCSPLFAFDAPCYAAANMSRASSLCATQHWVHRSCVVHELGPIKCSEGSNGAANATALGGVERSQNPSICAEPIGCGNCSFAGNNSECVRWALFTIFHRFPFRAQWLYRNDDSGRSFGGRYRKREQEMNREKGTHYTFGADDASPIGAFSHFPPFFPFRPKSVVRLWIPLFFPLL